MYAIRSYYDLCSLIPGGPHSLQQLDEAGGVPAVIAELTNKNIIHTDVMTVTGKTLGENLAKVKIRDHEIIRSIDNPYHARGGISYNFV